MLVFDSVIFSLTLYKAFTTGRGIRLLDVIVRDGVSCSILSGLMSLMLYYAGTMYYSYEAASRFVKENMLTVF